VGEAMSYDTYVHCHTCGENLLRDTSVNAGCSGLWEAAGAVLKDWDGKTAHEVLPSLQGAIQSLKDQPEYYRSLVDGKAFKSVYPETLGYYKDEFYTAAIVYLESIRDACCKDPFATVRVSH